MFPKDKYPKADIALVCPNLGDGGTQRVISMLANAWNQRGQTVYVITLLKDECAYKLDPGVHFIEVHNFVKIRNTLKQIRVLILNSIKFIKHTLYILNQKTIRLLKFIDSYSPAILKNSQLIALISHLVLKTLIGMINVFNRLGRYCVKQIKKGLDVMGSLHVFLMETPFLCIFNYPLYRRVQALRLVIKQVAPPVVVSFLPSANVTTILVCNGLDTRVVISERNDPARQKLRYPWNKLRPRYYNRADIVTANTFGALHTMRGYVDAHKLYFVPNPLKFNHAPASVSQSEFNLNKPFILSVGRLHPQKSLHVLIRAFAALPPEMSHWQLIIVGQGILFDELTYQAKIHGVENRVIFTGQVDDPLPYYRAGAIFALPSNHEGMSNALMEAMNHEMPVIVSDASPGPLELVVHNQTGLVMPVNDVESLTLAIEQLGNDKNLCRRLGKAARKRVHEHDLPNALATWGQVIGLEPATSLL